MTTLILTPRQTEDAQALWQAAIARGWGVQRLTSWRIPEGLQVNAPALYCEALFGPSLAEQLGVQLLDPAEDWLPSLPFGYRQRRVYLATLARARLLPVPMFVKPPNDKSFPARVYDPGALPDGFDEHMPVLVSEPVEFVREFRFFVLDRTVRAFSMYARSGEPCQEHKRGEEIGPRAFVERVLANVGVALPRAVVLDVGLLGGYQWAVVEANAAWGAGIYGCDPDACLDVVAASTLDTSTNVNA